MASTVIEFEVLSVDSDPEGMKAALNEIGARGFNLVHTHVQEKTYTFVLSRDTGRQREEASSSTEWVDDGFVNDETAWT